MKNRERREILMLLGLGFISPLWAKTSQIVFKNSSCNSARERKILVAYASEYGSTQGVAKAIAKELCNNAFSVDVMYIKDVKNIEKYEQVIIGSPIQYDTWMDDAKSFVSVHEKELKEKHVAYFFTCLTLSKRSEKTEKQAQGYANDLLTLYPQINPQSVGQFAGVLDYSKFSTLFKVLARGMFAVLGVKEGDYRDWDAIKAWSNSIKLKDIK